MLPVDFEIVKGDSCYISVTKLLNDVAQDFVEGEEVIFSAKKNLKQTTYDIQSSETTLTDGVNIIRLSPTDTDVELGKYYYDIQYTDTNNDIWTLKRGVIEIVWEVTTDGA